MKIIKSIIYVSILLQVFYISPLKAEVQEQGVTLGKELESNTYLNVARNELSIAYEKYNEGKISESKKDLKRASDWLYNAVNHSKSEKVKLEAKKLAIKIDQFQVTLSRSSEKNSIEKFLHHASSLILRESEQLYHSYTASANDNKTLKYLLDARMHFYNADHDLFISHDKVSTQEELDESIKNLEEANLVARPELKLQIAKLKDNIRNLLAITEADDEYLNRAELVNALDKAIIQLAEVKSIFSGNHDLDKDYTQLEKILENTRQLKIAAQKNNIKNDYDSIMNDFVTVINDI